MKHLFIAAILMISITATAQSPKSDYSVSKDNTGCVIFDGQITFDNLNKEKSFNWLQHGVDEYKPKAAAVAYLSKYLSQYNMVVFMGTWCSDSRYLIPKLEKVLQLTAYPMRQCTIYGVDHKKKTKAMTEEQYKQYNITLVPTIILLKGQHEVGRITETAKTSIEADLAGLIHKDRQQH